MGRFVRCIPASWCWAAFSWRQGSASWSGQGGAESQEFVSDEWIAISQDMSQAWQWPAEPSYKQCPLWPRPCRPTRLHTHVHQAAPSVQHGHESNQNISHILTAPYIFTQMQVVQMLQGWAPWPSCQTSWTQPASLPACQPHPRRKSPAKSDSLWCNWCWNMLNNHASCVQAVASPEMEVMAFKHLRTLTCKKGSAPPVCEASIYLAVYLNFRVM